jgi:plasmid stabilization system protein ParE
VSKRIVITSQAELQIHEIDAWWREHRDKAPDLFEEELARALKLIGTAPGAGKRYPHARATVRRVMMRGTRNHVYYVEREDHVLVIAVWGAVKGVGPDLEGL